MVDLNVKNLRIFLAVLEAGSMSGAAERMGMSQSAVTQRVRSLESQLGVTLIDRSLRPLRPTPAGEVFRTRAYKLLGEAEEMITAVSQIEHDQLPELRGAVVNSLTAILMPSVIRALGEASPARNLSIRSGLAIEHGQWLINREVDFLITTDTLEHVVDLERHPLLQEPFIIIAPPGRNCRGQTLSQLVARMPLIRFTARSIIGSQIERHLARIRAHIPRHIEFDSSESVVAMVAAGAGWAILTPVCLLQGLRSNQNVQALPFPGPQFAREITLVAHAGELGELPWRIAQVSRDVLISQCLPSIRELAPWAVESFSIRS